MSVKAPVSRIAIAWNKNLLQIVLASSCCMIKGAIRVLITCCGEHSLLSRAVESATDAKTIMAEAFATDFLAWLA